MIERRSACDRERLFIVDDHPLVRRSLPNVINQQWDLTVCGESEGRKSCIEVKVTNQGKSDGLLANKQGEAFHAR
jgi:hypothetical protein